MIRRNVPLTPRRKWLAHQNPYGSPSGTFPLSHLYHTGNHNNRKDDSKPSSEARTARLLGGLPLIRPSWKSHAVSLSFSTTSTDNDDDKKKATMREKAALYREQASHYSIRYI
jgi:hypothetical protein